MHVIGQTTKKYIISPDIEEILVKKMEELARDKEEQIMRAKVKKDEEQQQLQQRQQNGLLTKAKPNTMTRERLGATK